MELRKLPIKIDKSTEKRKGGIIEWKRLKLEDAQVLKILKYKRRRYHLSNGTNNVHFP